MSPQCRGIGRGGYRHWTSFTGLACAWMPDSAGPFSFSHSGWDRKSQTIEMFREEIQATFERDIDRYLQTVQEDPPENAEKAPVK